jgi:hypothetical protein
MAEFKLGRLRFVWKGTWATATAYVKDDIVRYGGISFVCVSGHTAAANFDTDLNADKWQKMAVGIEWKTNPWTPDALYKEGDVVRYGGKVYVCTDNHTADSTLDGGFYIDETANRWDLLSDGQEWQGDWATSTYYKLGDIVKYNSFTFVCKTPHTSAATAALGLETDSGKWDTYGEGFKWRNTWAPTTRYIAKLVSTEPAAEYEMRIRGSTTGLLDQNLVAIRKLTKRIAIDFSGNRYKWYLENDSSADYIVLTAL